MIIQDITYRIIEVLSSIKDPHTDETIGFNCILSNVLYPKDSIRVFIWEGSEAFQQIMYDVLIPQEIEVELCQMQRLN